MAQPPYDGLPVIISETTEPYEAAPVYEVDPAIVGPYGGIPVYEVDPAIVGPYGGWVVRVVVPSLDAIPVYPIAGTLGGPTFLLSGLTLEEGSAAGTLIGTITASDAGVITNLAITNTYGGIFALDGDDLEAGATPSDFEVTSMYNVEITGEIDGVPTTATFQVTIGNTSEFSDPLSVSFDLAIASFTADGDNWHHTWADDGHLYISQDDGLGWQVGGAAADVYNNRVWRLTGDVDDPTPVDLPGYPDRYIVTKQDYYGFGIVSKDDFIYHFITYLTPVALDWDGVYLVYSDDLGTTWKNQNGAAMAFDDTPGADTAFFWANTDDAFHLISALQMGQGYEHNTDGFFYFYSTNGTVDGKMNQVVLMRVAVADVLTKAEYEFCSDVTAGVATWDANIANRFVIHTFPTGWVGSDLPFSWVPSVIYNEPLGIYLMAAAGTAKGNGLIFNDRTFLKILKADNPWGPWTEIHSDISWDWPGGTAGFTDLVDKRAYMPQLSPKGISADGTEIWVVFSDFTNWGKTQPNPPESGPNYKHIVQKITLLGVEDTDGAAALLVGETDGFAADFTYDTDRKKMMAIKDVVPTFYKPSDFITWVGEAKRVYNEAGLLVFSPHNLFLNSNFPATQNVTLVVGRNYTVSVGGGAGTLTGSSGASGVASQGTPVTFVATGTTGTFTLSGSLTRIQINRGSSATDYVATTGTIRIGAAIDFNPDTLECRGILVEPSVINVAHRSQELATNAGGGVIGWVAGGLTRVNNAAVAPDGTTTAASMTETTGAAATHNIFGPVSGAGAGSATNVSGTTYTASVYAKANGRNFLQMILNDTGFPNTQFVNFDLVNGTFSATACTGHMEKLPNGWYRCGITATADATNTGNGVSIHLATSLAAARAESYVGDVTKGCFLWGAQLEIGAIPTSYILAITVSVTRIVDTAILSTAGQLGPSAFNAAEGTLFVEWIGRVAGGVGLSLNDDTVNEAIRLDGVGGNKRYLVNDGGAAQATITGAAYTPGTILKQAARYKLNDFQASHDGVAGTPDVSGTLPTVDRIAFGSVAGTLQANGWIRKAMLLPVAKNDAALDALTA